VLTAPPTCTQDGGSAIDGYDPGTTYTFTPAGPSVGAMGIITGMITGTQYTVTSSVGNCESEPSAPFSNAAASGQLDTPVISSAPPTCTQAGSTSISNYNPLLTYTFTPAGPTVAMPGTVSGMAVGASYTVQASEGPSCVSPQSATFSNSPQLPAPDISITGNLTHCPGGTTTITANGGVSYLWDDPAASTTASISVETGTFTVTGTDANGCTATANTVVSEGTPFTVTFTGDLSHCPGGSVSVTANGGVSYLWDSGATTATVTLTEGTYAVEATDADGCGGSGQVTIIEVQAPVADFTVINACAGEPVQFTDATTVSAGSLTGWSWTFGDGGVSTAQNPTRTYQNPGTYVVTLVASSGSCTDEVTLSATVYPNPTAAFTTANVCLGEDAVFTDNSSVTGSVIAQWAWEFGDNNVGLVQSPAHGYQQAGNYTVTLAVVTADMCTDIATGNITVYPAPEPAFSAPPVCLGQPTAFTNASTVSSGIISSHAWDFGDDAGTSANASPSYTYADDGSFPVTLEVTTSFGCVREVTQNVTVRPLPIIDAGHDNILCANQTNGRAFAQASGSSAPYEYQWNDPQQRTTPVIDNLGPGPYTIVVTDGQGCTNDTTVIVAQPLPLQVTVIAGNDTCGIGNGAVQAVPQGGTPPFIYQWSAIRDSSYIFNLSDPYSGWNTMLNPGEYTVLLTDSGGCTAQGAATVGQIPRPEAAFITRSRPEELKDPSVDFFNESVNAYSYEWHFGDGNISNVTHPDHDYERSGVYLVMLIARNEPRYGCADTIYKYVEVEPMFTFYVPNAFTPDGDGLNDTWGPQGANYEIESYNVQVYDRWGKLVWQTDNPEVWWNGTMKGEGGDVMAQGVYTYRIIVKYFSTFEPRVITGSVRLYKTR
jgi:gliding motility-associated-like protein